MNKLANVDTEALQAALATPSDPKATKRLIIALAYTDGVPVETLSGRYDVPRATIYSWLDRFEHRSISEAITDKSRPVVRQDSTSDSYFYTEEQLIHSEIR